MPNIVSNIDQVCTSKVTKSKQNHKSTYDSGFLCQTLIDLKPELPLRPFLDDI